MKKIEMNEDMICLCDRCIEAIKSRGEKVWVLEPIEDFDDFDLDEGNISELPICEWCEDPNEIDEEDGELIHDELMVCIFP